MLHSKPELKECLTRCRHCGLFFITDPRNAGRRDLHCPFGCREAHRRRESLKRSTEYYRSDVGRIKKRIQNDKRRLPREAEVLAEGVLSYAPWLIAYLKVLLSLIEGRRVGRVEIVELVKRVLRQHSMARRRRMEDIVAWLNKAPP